MRPVVAVLLLGFSNLIFSFWGGLLLSLGLSFFKGFRLIHFDSVLAYLIGSFLAFFFIVACRGRKKLPLCQVSLLLFAPVACLFFLTKNGRSFSSVEEMAAAVCFCGYFGIGSSLRAFRSDLSAQFSPRGLMVSELAYSTGYLLGLVTPVVLFEMKGILLGQLITSPLALIGDYLVYRNIAAHRTSAHSKSKFEGSQNPLLFPFLLFLGMTLCVQISFQRLGSLLVMSTPIAAFELGLLSLRLLLYSQPRV